MHDLSVANPSDMTMIMLLIVGGMLFLLSLVLFITGNRGKKIDGHPLCRTCGHDLYGSTNAVRNCPKCNRPLRYRKDVRVGNRKKQKGKIVTGFGGVLLAGVLGVFAIFPGIRSLDWLPQMPALTMPKFAMAAELHSQEDWKKTYKQLETSRVSKSQANRVARLALKLQEDKDRDWVKEADLWIEKVHEQQLLDDDLWMRYVNNVLDEQVAVLKVQFRPVIEHGSRPYYETFHHHPKRTGTLRLDFLGTRGANRLQVNDGRIYSLKRSDNEDWSTLPTGKVKLRYMMSQEYAFKRLYDLKTGTMSSKSGEVFVRDFESESEIEILPPGQSCVKPIKNAFYKAAVEESFEIQKVTFRPTDGKLVVFTNAQNTPIALVWEMKALIEGQAYPLEPLIRIPKRRSLMGARHGFFDDLINASIQKVDVVLTPSAEAARRSLDITEYWDGELVFKAVPVKLETQ